MGALRALLRRIGLGRRPIRGTRRASTSCEGDEAVEPDVLFLSGVDWRQIDGASGAESADPDHQPGPARASTRPPTTRCCRYRFLPHKAIRICVSPEVDAARSRRTGPVRGPVFTIPDAIDVAALERLATAAAARPRRCSSPPTSSPSCGAAVARAAGRRRAAASSCRHAHPARGAARSDGARARVDGVRAEPEGGLLPARARGDGARHAGRLPRLRREPLLLRSTA